MYSDDLILQAMERGKHRTKRDAVDEALQGYVAALQQQRILDLFGQVDFDPEYDDKEERRRA